MAGAVITGCNPREIPQGLSRTGPASESTLPLASIPASATTTAEREGRDGDGFEWHQQTEEILTRYNLVVVFIIFFGN